MAFTLVTVTHNFDLPADPGSLGTVEFTPTQPLHNGGNTITGTTRATLSSTGVLSQQVAATTDPATTPVGVPYRIVVRINGQPPVTYYAPIPHNQGSTLDLGTLLAWVAAGYGGGLATAASVTDGQVRAVIAATLDGDTTQRIGVPLYIYPDWYTTPPRVWDQIMDNAPNVRYVIANPNTGPGTALNTDYQRQIQMCQASGVKVLGYVSTHYATITRATILADATNWLNWYGIDGIFLDETSYASDQAHYLGVYQDVKALSANLLVVANPGLGVDVSMVGTADIFVSFEGDPTAYRARATTNAPAWERTAPAGKQWHMVHSVTSLAEAHEMLDLARTYRAGTVFVTDRGLPNPWLGLPTIAGMWESQLDRTRPPDLVAGTGGLSGLRFVGRKTSTGAPTTGTWAVGDLVVDSAGVWHLCTAAGTPGTWS